MKLDGTILIPYAYVVSQIHIKYPFVHSCGTIRLTLSLLPKTTTFPKTSQPWKRETTSNMPHLFIMLYIRLVTIKKNRQFHGPTNVGAFNHCLHHGMLHVWLVMRAQRSHKGDTLCVQLGFILGEPCTMCFVSIFNMIVVVQHRCTYLLFHLFVRTTKRQTISEIITASCRSHKEKKNKHQLYANMDVSPLALPCSKVPLAHHRVHYLPCNMWTWWLHYS